MGTAIVKRDSAGTVLSLPPSRFVDFEGKSNIPAPTLTNARIALNKLGLNCWHDLFSGKKYIGGSALNSEVGGQVTDDLVSAIRIMIRRDFDFDPGLNNTWQAINLFCREHGCHPVRDYLNACLADWEALDGGKRIDTMLIDYFGAPDTAFIRSVSRIVMVASARRIFDPGCKFDYMTVLESPEGYNKSRALAKLYGEQWFSDQTILGLDDKQLAETLRGRWCVECADLSGMRKADVEKVKAQLSRFEDRTRPAYGRAVIDAPRSSVFWGTTNETEYLRSQTGNRRFFPVPIKRIDVDAIERDRDLLWGEAMAAHLAGESIMLPESLWADAGAEQDARTVGEPWLDLVGNVAERAARHERLRSENRLHDLDESESLGVVYSNDGERERVTSQYVLGKIIGIPADRQTAEQGKRLGAIMRKLGWTGPAAFWIGDRTARGYERPIVGEPWLAE
jgi:predicted P-loop ATPase